MSYHSLPSRNRLEEHIHSRINSLAQELSISSDYVVYVLECGRNLPSGEREEWGRKFYTESEEYDMPISTIRKRNNDGSIENEFKKAFPGWFRDIKLADSIYYVGYTSNLPRRLFAHIFPTEDGALFTKMFEPNSLVAVKEYDNHKKAKQRESQISKTLDDSWIYHIQKDRMMRSIKDDGRKRERTVKNLMRGFELSDEDCLMKFCLNRGINRLSSVGNLKRRQQIHHKVQCKHLKDCLEYRLEQNCYCHIDNVDKRLDQVLDQLYSFYFGAFLYYRGMVRRMKSEQTYATYSM